ncbi:heparan-alpha-glucosaminide N-acetyltransferase domain-containing protein [Cellulomonas sp. PhB143]|uniref:heparan-alpha-glucosaminide N-acetyltransferase domain-containing protein n=1 Tax=Cellulomonas sp. PhB143 TaxID=2485186 RepID=UPI000F48FEF6|nr:heparan-alpha-glucosaminide N-acetyltransferase domain-containing protein [Cellulomonas sp. PhB143]ROS73541.1 uncharacterized protein DUF418 [Cellulomonas sp. PhB143]
MTPASATTTDPLRPGGHARPGAAHRLLGGPGRLVGLDVARGLAVLGMFAAHVGVQEGPDGAPWLGIADGRSSILFATVAGISLALVTGGTTPPGGVPLLQARARLFARAAVLLALAAVLDLLDTGIAIILACYGAYFVLAIPVLRWRPSRLLVAAGVVALVGSVLRFAGREAIGHAGLRYPHDGTGAATDYVLTGYYPALVWMAYVLVGLAIGRAGLSTERDGARLALVGAGATVVGYAASSLATARLGGAAAVAAAYDATTVVRQEDVAPDAPWPLPAALLLAGPHTDTPLEVLGSGGFAVMVVGACLVVVRARRVALVLSPLAAVGATALTVYTAQVVALWAVRTRWSTDLVRDASGNGPLVVMVVASLVLATAWRVVWGRGPLERLVTSVADRASRVDPAG